MTLNWQGEIALYQSSLTLLNVNRGTIITLDEEEQIEVDEGLIECLPLWRFLV